ncbi:hypothetical protein M0R45_001604 [Rubus argutus]|uniref:NADH dehydrogenase subunit 6 n=1 Tax=Rubus argutus TaxID=59490 RepID=A0AAW1VHF3_RUBAR
MVFLVLAFGPMSVGGDGFDQRTDWWWVVGIYWVATGWELAAEMTVESFCIGWVAIGSIDLGWFGGGLGTEGWGLCLGSGLGVVRRGCKMLVVWRV